MTALETVLAGLPADLPVPVAVVQHRDVRSATLANLLQRHTRLRVREPQDKEPFLPGHVYIAAPDYHLLVESDGFSLSTDPPVCHARPSIDVLFESAADAFGRSTIGVVLTGASSDGSNGCIWIKRSGGYLIVQDPTYAESPTMPRAAIAAATPDRILGLHEIAPAIAHLVGLPVPA
jgi:two-component system chemotaxis response regulator CheB